jgi:hypothetical protein
MEHTHLLLSCTNLDKAVELLKAVSAIPIRESTKHPEFRIFHNIGKGYTLRIKRASLNAGYRKHLNEIVESRKLAIRESNPYLEIYGHSI